MFSDQRNSDLFKREQLNNQIKNRNQLLTIMIP